MCVCCCHACFRPAEDVVISATSVPFPVSFHIRWQKFPLARVWVERSGKEISPTAEHGSFAAQSYVLFPRCSTFPSDPGHCFCPSPCLMMSSFCCRFLLLSQKIAEWKQAGERLMLLHLLAPSRGAWCQPQSRGLVFRRVGAKARSWVADDVMERCFRKAGLEGSKK